MKKIGIVTMFYKNINYGGVLQAFALCKFLNKNGYDAEQIRFVTSHSKKEGFFSAAKRMLSLGIDYVFYTAVKKISVLKKGGTVVKSEITAEQKNIYSNEKKMRKEAFEKFAYEFVPSSDKVYYADTICDAGEHYDCFITGSDQVWNFRSYNPIYFLKFAQKDKIKLSYAASFSMDNLLNWQKRALKNHLSDFKAVSVREKQDLSFLEKIKVEQKEYVLDPTLLLEKEDWDEICESRLVDDRYVFCYFLGENVKEREIAKWFAKEKGLTLVTISHAGGGMRAVDFDFGDIRFGAASPNQFISLIKYADYVFTDSFHAIVFSKIYNRQYFIFNRNSKKSMTSRIKCITALFGTEERYCDSEIRENYEYVCSLEDISYISENNELADLKRSSVKFLLDNLGA